MSTYARAREDFIVLMSADGMAPEIARRIMRHANTVQRLAVAECNGDAWLNSKGPRCHRGGPDCKPDHTDCGEPVATLTRPPSLYWALVRCPSCLSTRTERLIREWCTKASGAYITKRCACGVQHSADEPCCRRCYPDCCGHVTFEPVFQGDPRGCCVRVRVPSGKYDSMHGDGICVPTRRY